jgi:Zn-dependent protease
MLIDGGYLAGSVVGLFLHEAGHFCMARHLGVRIKRFGMTWRGPYIVRESGPPNANILVSAAGPWVNLLLAASLWHALPSFAFANIVLGLGNLAPTPNSDGRRIWRAFSLRRDSARRADPAD